MNKNPKRGEIWFVDFNPTKGKEIQKIRPAVVISSDAIGKLPLKLVVPITEWKDTFKGNIWHVQLTPSSENGLNKESTVDALQTRSVDILRCKNKIGHIRDAKLLDIGGCS